jgi:hypothetical protein
LRAKEKPDSSARGRRAGAAPDRWHFTDIPEWDGVFARVLP